jgi:hypothetical protein
VLSLLRRKQKLPAIENKPLETNSEPPRRRKQQNIKVTDDCASVFAALAEAQGMSKAALFEDMVAERYAAARQQGLRLGID